MRTGAHERIEEQVPQLVFEPPAHRWPEVQIAQREVVGRGAGDDVDGGVLRRPPKARGDLCDASRCAGQAGHLAERGIEGRHEAGKVGAVGGVEAARVAPRLQTGA